MDGYEIIEYFGKIKRNLYKVEDAQEALVKKIDLIGKTAIAEKMKMKKLKKESLLENVFIVKS